ncbi:PilZ domain-containing protein [Tardiphaga sp. vice352]|uniref:PilZ domain-containing protein n=1 Tax=unclassified Tardiphaga TaxID=2631404 RepID=UPI001163EBC4|nr:MULTISPECIES: PilZ domain-containing protein [unclassified Tardiphaga]MBC7584484.1 PilZ domain-containing protein [Tardiphaga sp.]QDM16758.1 PilZ domain-containing protein [Tardiphaga sp. vice278]QDM21753.1 PilZ domain-containing protein [Tardiphaga sp. vice154]QDM26935.1 PilZ domain-containing protein [Tardiphaga sp. vice304]QDM32033.1 PilZ domain-containing protein [Tardiphaga sp. vice352]
MATENTGPARVVFGRGYSVWIMAIDGTWRRNCLLKAVSSVDAELTLEGSIEGLHLKEFFLLLSSTGLAYRRCELVKVNGAELEIRFLSTKPGKAKRTTNSDMADA